MIAWGFAILVCLIPLLAIGGTVVFGALIILMVLASPFIYAYNKANQD
jgi:hypothetical protein